VSEKYGQGFEYTKHHDISHVIPDMRMKGSTRNSNARVGEGVNQEVAEAALTTNFRNMEAQVGLPGYSASSCADVFLQVARADSNQEAIARIKMQIEDYDVAVAAALATARAQAVSDRDHDMDDDDQTETMSPLTQESWTLGARDPSFTTSLRLELEIGPHRHAFRKFGRRLTHFFERFYPTESLGDLDYVKVCDVFCVGESRH
jgi:hypothetical protein